jgi:carbamoyltransferase
MIVLGLNAYHGDSAACIVVDGRLIAAVEEERLRRVKHWAGFPVQAIEYCLATAGCTLADVDHVAVNRDPKANLFKKAMFAVRHKPHLSVVKDRMRNATKIRDVKAQLMSSFGLDPQDPKLQMHYVEHHVAHLASTFLVSPFEQAAVVSVDGFGDFVGAMTAVGSGNRVSIRQRVFFPHSLGLVYLALTQFLGFPHYGDEFKVMGLAAYGEPEFMDAMRQLVRLQPDGTFELGLEYFQHHTTGVSMTWESGAPVMGSVFSPRMAELLGPARGADEPLTDRHRNLAASLQRIYEEAFFLLLANVEKQSGLKQLCLAGGCAMNSVANGKVFDRTGFRDVYVPPAPGDAGGAIGAAYYVWNQKLGRPREFVMRSPYWGPEFSTEQLRQAIAGSTLAEQATIDELDEQALPRRTAQAIVDGDVVGWYQGRMEWGPRALGNRSILVDPRRSDMKDILNARIKRRELFRPFAPAILEEATSEYFEHDEPDPFMSKVYRIRPEKHASIPAAVHVDGTGRLQTVRREDNPRYWGVIDQFRQLTGVPILINTSFNENEPIVHEPEQAINCFLRTKMDVLVLGPFFLRKKNAAIATAAG